MRTAQRVGLVLIGLGGLAWGGLYSDGSKVNLLTIRGTTATTIHDVSPGNGGPLAPLHPTYGGEVRTGTKQGAETSVWWQATLPGVYQASNYSLQFYGPTITCTDFTIQASLDGTNWSVVDTVTANASATVTRTFNAGTVNARYLKLDVTGYNSSTYGLILQKAAFFGPNNPSINENISVAQSTWNGGSARLDDPWTGNSGARPNLVDDYPQILTSYYTNGVGQQETNEAAFSTMHVSGFDAPPGVASSFTLALREAYALRYVGLSRINDNRAARDIDIYLSPDISGTNWKLVKQMRDIPNDVISNCYFETTIDNWDILAQRVRFDVIRDWKVPAGLGDVNGNLIMADGYISEFFLYIPEPASLGLLGLAGLWFARRRPGRR